MRKAIIGLACLCVSVMAYGGGWTIDGVKQMGDAATLNGQAASYYLDLANHTGTLASATQTGITQLGTVTNGTINSDDVVAGLTGVTLDTAAATVLVGTNCNGRVRINGDDDAIDYTLPAAEAGLVISFANHLYAQVITVDAAAGDIIILNDGTALDAGDATDSSGAIDDKGTFIALDGTYWLLWGEQNTWVDGGAD